MTKLTKNINSLLVSFVEYAPFTSAIFIEVGDGLRALMGVRFGLRQTHWIYHRHGVKLKCEVTLSVVHTTE